MSTLAFTLVAATSAAHAGPLYKCKDATGKTVYSDTDCRTHIPVVAPQARRSAIVAPGRRVDKLTETVVDQLLHHAVVLAENGDHAGQCALAAPDLSFSIVDRTVFPEQRRTGGRKEICKLQRDSAIELRQNGVSARVALHRLKIKVNPEGTQATATYQLQLHFDAGDARFAVRCERDDRFGLHDGGVFFTRVSSDCVPAT
ncbi:MAG: DUF4124 domain-containing protein [Hydrogenophaga sp.]|nr:DUF4124 domain-containing protein [Hydrogenophaga sp.]